MSDRPPYATFADGHEAMLVGDTIARSSRSGSWTTVERATAPVAQGVAS
jgi:hypothetical protein